jgi:ketosteroid isomerase-like protein
MVAVVDSSNMLAVKGLWRDLERGGVDAAMESMLSLCHEDAELRPYVAGGRTLHGADEVRDYFREIEAGGDTLHASPWSFEEIGDDIVVAGSIRVQRGDGSIADAQVSWTFRFRDGLIGRADFEPLAASVAR